MEIFDKILKLYSEINNIYHRLLQFEFDQKIDGCEFAVLLKSLKKNIDLEREMFSEFLEDYSDDYQWILNLLEHGMLELEDYVVSRLQDYMSIHVNDILLDDISFEEQMEKESTNRLDTFYRQCSKNLYLVYLSFLTDYINSFAFSSVKMPLLGFKYFNSIINHDIESVLVYNNFNVGKCNYVDVNFMSTGLGIDGKLSEEVRYMVYEDAVKSSVIELLSFNDSDYNDDYKKANVINCECMLRAGLLLLSDDVEGYEMAINTIDKLIQEMGSFYNGLSVDIIKSTIGCKKIDNNRIKKLSVR